MVWLNIVSNKLLCLQAPFIWWNRHMPRNLPKFYFPISWLSDESALLVMCVCYEMMLYWKNGCAYFDKYGWALFSNMLNKAVCFQNIVKALRPVPPIHRKRKKKRQLHFHHSCIIIFVIKIKSSSEFSNIERRCKTINAIFEMYANGKQMNE